MYNYRYEHVKSGREDFLSNILRERAFLIEEAARLTGFRVFVTGEARSRSGYIVPDCVAIWTLEPSYRDHGPFWQEYHRLVAITAGLPLPVARALLAAQNT